MENILPTPKGDLEVDYVIEVFVSVFWPWKLCDCLRFSVFVNLAMDSVPVWTLYIKHTYVSFIAVKELYE